MIRRTQGPADVGPFPFPLENCVRSQRRAKYVAIFDQVLDEIIQQLERGTRPWECPWVGGDGPRNHRTLRYYSGINELILISAAHNLGFQHHRWLTAKQAQVMRGEVREGERGTTIVVGGTIFSRKMERKRQAFGRLYSLFNIAQCIGVSMPIPPPPSPGYINQRIEALVAATGIKIKVGGCHAFYTPETDSVQIPPQSAFFEPAAYYRTLLHEIAHALMGPHRLNTLLPNREPCELAAWREIVAELASAFGCRVAGITLSVRPADYIAGWLDALQSVRRVVDSDPRWVLEVSHHAEDVAGHLLSYER
jgi:antirestriction protein ArdC